MPVLVLMYHHTPRGACESQWDVPLDRFKQQISQLIAAGASFVPLDGVDAVAQAREVKVAVTFDDGHASNEDAVAFLASKSILPSLFIVRDWAQQRDGFLNADAIRRLAPACAFGSHSVSHPDLASLPEDRLREELADSRHFLEETLSKSIDTMALPGGSGDGRVLRVAGACGYRIICNSVPLLHAKPGASVNRVVVTANHDERYLVDLYRTGRTAWFGRKQKFQAARAASAVLGKGPYSVVSKLAKQVLRRG